MKLSHILFALAFLLAIPALVGLADAWLYVFAGRTMIAEWDIGRGWTAYGLGGAGALVSIAGFAARDCNK